MYIMAVDQGTTGSTIRIYDRELNTVGKAYAEITNYYPKPGYVEHDGEEIFNTTQKLMLGALEQARLSYRDIAAIGITNQRETVLAWDRQGKPIGRAIVWQCGRTAELCRSMVDHVPDLKKRTGLVLNPYFSATKMKWLIDNLGVRHPHNRFGTIDSWLVYRLTGGKRHLTDYTNASRTLLFDIGKLDWDEDLLDLFGVPREMLPEVVGSSGEIGFTDPRLTGGCRVPITGLVGDQQSALFGQLCVEKGSIKNTYGTGSFILQYLGKKPIISAEPILTTVCVDKEGKPAYAFEGAIFSAGSVVQWLRDSLRVIENAAQTDAIAAKTPDTGGVYFVPAFNGLGAPHWNPDARAAILGMTRGTSREQIIRAALEGIAFQCKDLIEIFTSVSAIPLKRLSVDGGAAMNNFLMQFQADILGIPVIRPEQIETTVLGAALLAGLGSGYFSGFDEIRRAMKIERIFDPEMELERRDTLVAGWRAAIERVKM